ncbi:hypothetical protein [Nannocystis punicea]|uniref:Uncharacterized protein n=1 Tax=Nannocystis punicea TaxID=2995304 RepID=A0ABY7GTW8_9BACT|nr:hypothetical protein [Nannocystis poenicansa]WAS90353.1 hypothetical protein O0S08_29550 [Nannocystis poenicansa]
MAITLDLSHLPLVLTRFDGEQSLDEVEQYIGRMSEVHALRQPYISIIWLRRYARGPAHTDRIGRWIKDTEEAARQYCLGAAMISQSTGFRFALAAIFLIRPMPCPYLVCGTWSEAIAYACGQAGKAGVPLPELASPWPGLD